MATINITTNAAQDVIIQRVVDAENARRAVQDPPLPLLDIPGYVIFFLTQVFIGWRTTQAQDDLQELKEAWFAATTQQKNEIRAILGV